MALQSNTIEDKTPTAIHVINISCIIIFFIVIYLCSVDHKILRDSIIILFIAFLTLYIYTKYHNKFHISSIVFGLSIAFILYIILAENIIHLVKFYNPNIIRKLDLSPRLLNYVDQQLPQSVHNDFFENVGDDPLFYRRIPGSLHRHTYDSTSENKVFEVNADETGYLNSNKGYYNSVDQIDIFIAGDSVLQGVGMPSVIDGIKAKIPYSMWNLSTGSYSPRQKVEALIRYALPKKPKWLIIDFYSGNDASEANEDEICEESGNFKSRFAIAWMKSRFKSNPKYHDILRQEDSGIIFSIIHLRTDNFTLVLTSYATRRVKNVLQEFTHWLLHVNHNRSKTKTDGINNNSNYNFAYPAYSHFEINRDKYQLWVKYGINNTINYYNRLVKIVNNMPDPPKIVILYNPSSYEIYRDILIKTDPEYDQLSKIQIDKLKLFADQNNILFVNLLPGIIDKIKDHKTWLYGQHDSIHWSRKGSIIIEEVLYSEIIKIVGLKKQLSTK